MHVVSQHKKKVAHSWYKQSIYFLKVNVNFERAHILNVVKKQRYYTKTMEGNSKKNHIAYQTDCFPRGYVANGCTVIEILQPPWRQMSGCVPIRHCDKALAVRHKMYAKKRCWISWCKISKQSGEILVSLGCQSVNTKCTFSTNKWRQFKHPIQLKHKTMSTIFT